MPDIQFVGAYTVASSPAPANNHTVTVVAPPGSTEGDYLVALFSCEYNTTITPPLGWTLLAKATNTNSAVYSRYHPAGALPTATFTILSGEVTSVTTSWRNVDSVYSIESSSSSGSQYKPPNSSLPSKRMVVSLYTCHSEEGINNPTGNPTPSVAGQCSLLAGNASVRYPSLVAYGVDDTTIVPQAGSRFATTDSGFSRVWSGHTLVLNRKNTAPTVTLTNLRTTGDTAQRGFVTRANHSITDPDAGDVQSAFEHRYRPVGSPTWLGPYLVNSSQKYYDYGVDAFSQVGPWERQVRAYDYLNAVSAWTASGTFQVIERPPKPVIVFPTVDSRVPNTVRITWTAASQEAYEIEIRDESDAVEWSSGVVESSSARSATISFPNLGNKKIALRVRYTTLWSLEWAVVGVEVVATPVTSLDRVVDPFIALDSGYDTVSLSWTAPLASAWTGIRLVRSRSGYPIVASDGILVVEDLSGAWSTLTNYQNTGLTGGWHYYALFLRGASGWVRVGATSVLVPYDYGSTDKLWDTIPEYYKNIQDDSAAPSLRNERVNPALYLNQSNSAPNLLLSSFLNLFGLGFDYLRTQGEQVLGGYDVNTVHVSRLSLLAKQFGRDLEQAVPAYANRTVVRNLAYLHRKRGTVSGIRETVSMATGWDVEVELGNNLLLTTDQSELKNPTYEQWDPNRLYTPGTGGRPPDRVKYGSYIFQNILASRGAAQPPPSSGVSNTWWSYVAYPRLVRDGVNPETNDFSSWQLEFFPGGVRGGTTYVGVGAPEPEAGLPQVSQTNALAMYRTDSDGGTSMRAFSVPARLASQSTANTREMMLKYALPVPRAVAWVTGKAYPVGALVSYQGAAYESLEDENVELPTVTTHWTRRGYDDRIGMTLSFFAHGPFTGGANGTGGQPSTPYFTEYDEAGAVIRTVDADQSVYDNLFFDSFADSARLLTDTANRHLPTAVAWSAGAGTSWSTQRDSNGSRAVPPSGRSNNYVPLNATTGSNNLNIAVTYTSDPGTTRRAGIVFRWTDASNYWIASQTGLYKVVAGAAPANPATGALIWTKFTTGERMRVNLNGDVISVYRNATLLGSATDSFASTAFRHGIGIETD